jgi:hypothetical protein
LFIEQQQNPSDLKDPTEMDGAMKMKTKGVLRADVFGRDESTACGCIEWID